MAATRRIAYVMRQRCGYAQRLMRGVYRFIDEHGPCLIREFVVERDGRGPSAFSSALEKLVNWRPDAILSALMDEDLSVVRRVMGEHIPQVNLYASTPGPQLAVVTGSHRKVVAAAVRHLRQIGVRSPAFISLEGGAASVNCKRSIVESVPNFDAQRNLLIYPVDAATVENPDAQVQPIPSEIVTWLRALSRPTGLMCFGLGAGDYLLRICRELGLRVPDDLVIICVDDADVCLRSEPSMTSVAPVGEQVGYEGMRVLDELIRTGIAPRGVVRIDAVEVVARHSTARRASRCDIPAAIRFIRDNACRGLTIAEVLAHMPQGSRMTFYKEFQQVSGCSPGEFIRDVQISEAKRQLVNTHLTVTQIAITCGFSDGSAFARVFRSVTGKTPTAYRCGVQSARN